MWALSQDSTGLLLAVRMKVHILVLPHKNFTIQVGTVSIGIHLDVV